MRDPYYEAVQPVPQIVSLINKAGDLLRRRRAALQSEDVDDILECLSIARTALDGEVSDWAI